MAKNSNKSDIVNTKDSSNFYLEILKTKIEGTKLKKFSSFLVIKLFTYKFKILLQINYSTIYLIIFMI